MKEEIIDWLRDAYAMERGLEVTLKKMAQNNELTSDVRSATANHCRETEQHAQTLRGLLESLGSDASTVKTGLGIMTETMKGLGTKMATDETIKDLLSSYAAEHFEIACYTALVAGANQAGLSEVAAACQEIIEDEQRMAQTIADALPMAVQNHLAAAAHA